MADSACFHYLDEKVRGDDVGLRFTVTTPNGAAKDLTGAVIAWVLKTADKLTEVLNQDTVGVTWTIESPSTDGFLTVSMSDVVTAGLTESLYYDELKIIDGNGSDATVAYGNIPFRDSQV